MKKYLLSIIALAIFTISCSDNNNEETIVVPKNDNTYIPSVVRPALENTQRNAFRFFYDGADPQTGLIYEGNDRGTVLATGGTGFGLMALIVGAERNWITRQQAAERTLKIVTFLKNAERFKGVWSHWYNTDGTAHPFGDQVKTGDVVETGLLTGGLIAAKEYYTGSSATESQISTIVDELWNTIDWNFYTNGQNVLHWLWYSEQNKFSLDIRGWNEALNSYIFALAAPNPHNISAEVYKQGWQSNGGYFYPNRQFYGYPLPLSEEYGGPMFLSQYSMLGFNPKQMKDNSVDYWVQCTSHTMINRHYCVYKAPAAYKYKDTNWGLTACYGAGSEYGYKARSPRNDDGVIAPTAALGSYPYTPFYSTQVMLNVNALSYLQGTYGIGDSYRPMENAAEKKNLAIDQGPIVVMIENYRSGLIWNLVMKNANVQKGLQLAGISSNPTFDDGFYRAVINTETKVYDMMIHPDREKYELDFFVNASGKADFTVVDSENKSVYTASVNATKGANVFSFFDDKILRGKKYQIKMDTGGKVHTLNILLR